MTVEAEWQQPLPQKTSLASPIKKDTKLTYSEIQDIMKTSSESLTRILHDCLGVRKRCACWVPHNLSEERRYGGMVHPHARKI